MPEGHSIHRLALAFDELLHGERLTVTSPQGRFAAGAALLDGHRLVATDAHGKHLFLGFSSEGATPQELRWLRVHLGLYGSWTFTGDPSFQAPHAIGAPRRRVAEEETALPDDGAPVTAPADGPWEPPEPRGAVRVRLLGERGVADLTGPTACEVVTPQEKAAVHDRLGPDPLRADGDAERFVANVRRRARPVGELLMDQAVIAGVGNIYRAEALYRARVHPRRLGRAVPAAKLRAMWADLAALMADGVATGRIVTTEPEDRQEEDDRWYVYHRSGRSCLRCGSKVAEDLMAGRRVFWCPREQRRPADAR
ncbi:Fpg/Nei family DNA glycosylase [Georgenia sp. H159]|uniref:Fpg/Nei family DNA glycosylase n=1 Tax=Georgenia sp. H159 TaxID=3076115 RepID=UPI002D7661F1|nr:DNA-formamidopyrimidine glycosylase family protein [Georgenia sp. H159]